MPGNVKCINCLKDVPAAALRCPYCDHLFGHRHASHVDYGLSSLAVRLSAALLDGIFFLLMVGCNLINSVTLRSNIIFLITILMIMAYKPFTELFFGMTLGKSICGVKVMDKEHKNISFFAALMRFIPFMPFYILTFNLIKDIFDSSRYTSFSGLLSAVRGIDFRQDIFTVFLYGCAFAVILIDVLPIIFTEKKQAIHDMISGSFCFSREIAGNQRNQRPFVIFILLCIVVIYYFLTPHEKLKFSSAPSAGAARQYLGACIIDGFGLRGSKPVVCIDSQWFAAGDRVCRGIIVKVTHKDAIIKFGLKKVDFKLGEKIEQ